MKRLFPRIAVGFLTLAIGYYAQLEADRIADLVGPDVENISAPDSPQAVDPIIETSCDKITNAWYAGTLASPIPSHVQIRCWGVDEGKAHPLAQIIAHSPGH
jgi:hypothetical protein